MVIQSYSYSRDFVDCQNKNQGTLKYFIDCLIRSDTKIWLTLKAVFLYCTVPYCTVLYLTCACVLYLSYLLQEQGGIIETPSFK